MIIHWNILTRQWYDEIGSTIGKKMEAGERETEAQKVKKGETDKFGISWEMMILRKEWKGYLILNLLMCRIDRNTVIWWDMSRKGEKDLVGWHRFWAWAIWYWLSLVTEIRIQEKRRRGWEVRVGRGHELSHMIKIWVWNNHEIPKWKFQETAGFAGLTELWNENYMC